MNEELSLKKDTSSTQKLENLAKLSQKETNMRTLGDIALQRMVNKNIKNDLKEFIGASTLKSENILTMIHDFINSICDISLNEVTVHYMNTSVLKTGKYYKSFEKALYTQSIKIYTKIDLSEHGLEQISRLFNSDCYLISRIFFNRTYFNFYHWIIKATNTKIIAYIDKLKSSTNLLRIHRHESFSGGNSFSYFY